jgi:ribonuclease Z
MAKIIFLGTASSIPTKDRDNTSFVFIHKKETFLIDCPGAISHKLLKVGIDFKKVNKVIITHQHPDHIYGIISLIHTQAFLNKHLHIYSNAQSRRLIKKLIKLFRLDRKHFPRLHYTDVFKKGGFYSRNGLRLKAVRNKHMAGSFGVHFSFGKKRLFYSSDTAFSKKMLAEAAPFDCLIHDCTASSSYFRKHPQLFKMHTNSRQLARYLRRWPDAKLIPVHFLLLEKGEEARIKKELAPLNRRLVLARDFQKKTI